MVKGKRCLSTKSQINEMHKKLIFISMCRMLLPNIIFSVIYKIYGLKYAIVISCIIGSAIILLDIIKERSIKNSAIIGIVILILQMLSSFFSGYEKLYYIPALLENCIVMSLVIGMCVKSKSVFLFLVKDFEFELFENLNDRDVLSLNYIWIVYCMLKIISKIVGMITLDFIKLYWLVFKLN